MFVTSVFARAKRKLFLVWGMVALASCASKPVVIVQNERPLFKLETYFAGHTHSWGVFENRAGEPTEILRTVTNGRWDGEHLHFEQDITFGSGKKEHRSWLITRLDDRHYSATGTGIVGIALGETSGNALHLDFTLDAVPGNPLGHVHMSQWLYLHSDGKMVVNRATVTKAGIVVAEITEQFQKDR